MNERSNHTAIWYRINLNWDRSVLIWYQLVLIWFDLTLTRFLQFPMNEIIKYHGAELQTFVYFFCVFFSEYVFRVQLSLRDIFLNRNIFYETKISAVTCFKMFVFQIQHFLHFMISILLHVTMRCFWWFLFSIFRFLCFNLLFPFANNMLFIC